MEDKKEYHILSLSGGKDSTALAFFMRDNMPEIFEKLELVFCDTECELPETYDYLNKIEVFLGKKIHIVKPEKSFEHLITTHGYLPSPVHRWCTVELKAKPFEKFIANRIYIDSNSIVNLYIGIRADELQRAEYNKYKNKKIREVYPFVDNNLTHSDIMEILNNHPDLFFKAKEYEDARNRNTKFKKVGWNMDMLLEDMIKPDNIKKIKKAQVSNKDMKSDKLFDLIN